MSRAITIVMALAGYCFVFALARTPADTALAGRVIVIPLLGAVAGAPEAFACSLTGAFVEGFRVGLLFFADASAASFAARAADFSRA